jgi:hypothetical protein
VRYTLRFLFLLFSLSLLAQSKQDAVGFIQNKGQLIDQNGKTNKAVQYLLNIQLFEVFHKKRLALQDS